MNETDDLYGYATSLEQLSQAFGNSPAKNTFLALCDKPKFPRIPVGNGLWKYSIAQVAVWLERNRGAYARELWPELYEPTLQKEPKRKHPKKIDPEYEDARYKKAKADRMELEVAKKREVLCVTALRDEDEAARFTKICNVIQDTLVSDAQTFLSKTTIAEVSDAAKSTAAKILKTIQSRFEADNEAVEVRESIKELPMEVDNEEKEIESTTETAQEES